MLSGTSEYSEAYTPACAGLPPVLNRSVLIWLTWKIFTAIYAAPTTEMKYDTSSTSGIPVDPVNPCTRNDDGKMTRVCGQKFAGVSVTAPNKVGLKTSVCIPVKPIAL